MKKFFLLMFSLVCFLNANHPNSNDLDHKNYVHKVIIPSDWQPYFKVEKDGKPTGFAIDMFEEIAKRANIKYDYVIVPTWKELWKPFETGEVDIVPDLGISKEREAYSTISQTTNTFEIKLFRRVQSKEDIKTIEDLKGKKVAVVHKNLGQDVMNNHKEIESVVFPNHFEAVRALLSGEVDAFCYPKSLMDFTLKSMNIDDKIESFYKPLYEVKRGVGISNSHLELLEPINKAIDSIKKDGTYDKIYKKWFEKPKLIEFTKEELAFIILITLIIFGTIIFTVYFITTRNKWLLTKKDLETEIDNKTKKIKEKDIFLESIYNSMPSIIFTKDDNGMINANHTFFEITNMKDIEKVKENNFCIASLFENRENYINQNMGEKFWIDYIFENQDEIHKAVIIKNNKEHIYQIRVVEMPYKKGLKLVVLNEITELEEIKDELERSNEDLQQFAYIASHDLQEPLRMVSSYLQLIERRYKEKLDQDGIDFINFAVDGAKRMQNLINGLLQFSRVKTQGEELLITDMNSVFSDVLDNLSIAIKEKEAQINITKTLPNIRADKRQMIQLMQNIISNAIKYNDNKPVVDIDFEQTAENIIFSIKDNGIGMEEQYFDKIFLIFQRLHQKGDKYGGTGIGLAVCKRIVQRHHGKIWLESQKDKGTTFYVSFPNKG